MGLKLEVGKFYKNDEGEMVGPIRQYIDEMFDVADDGPRASWLWGYDGSGVGNCDLIAEWQDTPTSPVRTVTRTTREIVPGEYDGLDVGRAVNGMVFLAMPIANHCQESIDAIIANLTAIRDALEEQ